jgi:hypothetical protein
MAGLTLASEDEMGKPKRESLSDDESLLEPDKLSPIPGAAPPEEPQVDEVLPPDEKREYRKTQRERGRSGP